MDDLVHFMHISFILDLKMCDLNIQNLEPNLFTFEIFLSNVCPLLMAA
jgi:hypothetical protein